MQITENSLGNILGGKLVVECPGKSGADFKVVAPADNSNKLLVVFDAKSDKPTTKYFDLAAGVKIADNGIAPTVKDGIFTVTVSYNLGSEVAIG